MVTEGRILKGIRYNWCFGGLLKMCMVFVCREDEATSDYMEVWRGGWLEHPFGVGTAAAPGRHTWLVHHRATQQREGPPRELGKAGLGLMAQCKAVFWRAAYHVRDYQHIKQTQN